jgi:hypothetical protein
MEMTMNANTQPLITVSTVKGNARLLHLPAMFGSQNINGWPAYVYGEKMAYAIMGEYDHNYTGGMWTFAKTSNHGRFMYPKTARKTIFMDNSLNGCQCDMSPQAAGLVVSILAIGAVMAKTMDDSLMDNHDALMEYVYEHKEKAALLQFLD